MKGLIMVNFVWFQHTAARRRLAIAIIKGLIMAAVSTHSRPKAAGCNHVLQDASTFCFNTQPPEGGWRVFTLFGSFIGCFNTQPPEGGWMPWPVACIKAEFQHTAA